MGRSGAGTALRLFRLSNWRTNHIVLERHALQDQRLHCGLPFRRRVLVLRRGDVLADVFAPMKNCRSGR
nr:hypothetical protein CIT39_15085 [Bradyrhizobium symbiodeficiens]